MLLLWKEKTGNNYIFQTFSNEYIHFLLPLILHSECSSLSQLAWVEGWWFMQVSSSIVGLMYIQSFSCTLKVLI